MNCGLEGIRCTGENERKEVTEHSVSLNCRFAIIFGGRRFL